MGQECTSNPGRERERIRKIGRFGEKREETACDKGDNVDRKMHGRKF